MNGDFRVGPWLVAPGLNSISSDRAMVRLEPKAMEVLVCLAEHAGETLHKEIIFKAVWPDTFVTDDVLTHSISELRRAFADDAREPRIIQTIPKRGYRLIAPVTWVNGTGNLSVQGTSDSVGSGTGRVATRKFRILGLSLAAIALLSALLIVFGKGGLRKVLARSSNVSPIHSLAVLPLQNLSNDPAQEYFSDGLTDALITDLAQIESIRVTSRTSVLHYKKTDKTLPEIARELNVDGIIEGTVQRSGDRVRITAQLVHASDKHLWANSYEADMRDVFELERGVTQDIAHQIRARLATNGQPERAQQPWPMDPKALDAYLQGNYHLNRQGKGFGDEEKRIAAQYFEQAIAADPKFGPAYHGLALAHDNLFLGSAENVATRLKAAKKGVEVDPNYPDIRVTVAAAKWIPHLDWEGAESDLRRARELDPRSPIARSALCGLLIVRGHAEEGLPECRIAQRLDPLDDDAAYGLYLGRDYDGAIAMFTAVLQGDNDGRLHCELFPSYAMKKMQKEMIQEVQQCYALYGFTQTAANIGLAYKTSGYLAAIRQWAKETEQLQAAHQVYLPGFLVDAYAILGDKDHALFWLEQAYEHREMDSLSAGVFYMGAEPMYDPLRSDPRFNDILQKVGLAK